MAMMKRVVVEANSGEKFKCEARIRGHVVRTDQPKPAGGEDSGPTPLEHLLFSLAGCVAAIGRIIANQQEIDLHSMAVRVEGELDTETLMGKSQENRAGFKEIRVVARIDADMTSEEKKAFLHEIDVRCPVSDNMARTSLVSFEVAE